MRYIVNEGEDEILNIAVESEKNISPNGKTIKRK